MKRIFLWASGGLLALAVCALFMAPPALRAALCPGCFGLQPVLPHVYADRPAPELEAMFAAARQQVGMHFGDDLRDPRWLVCTQAACQARLGGGRAKAMAYGAAFVHIAPEGVEPTIIAHEWAHIVLHDRIGVAGMVQNALPAWLDEGIAVLVSRDPRYWPDPHRCDALQSVPLPENPRIWRRQAGHRPSLYAAAACAVARQFGEGDPDAAIAPAIRAAVGDL